MRDKTIQQRNYLGTSCQFCSRFICIHLKRLLVFLFATRCKSGRVNLPVFWVVISRNFSSLLIKESFSLTIIILLLIRYFIFGDRGAGEASKTRVKHFKWVNFILLAFLTLFTCVGFYSHHIREQFRYKDLDIQHMSEQTQRSQFSFEGETSQAISQGHRMITRPYTKK